MAKEDVIRKLNEMRKAEHRAVLQYATHAVHLRGLGIESLADEMEEEAQEELEHAGRLGDRILFLGGTLDISSPEPIDAGVELVQILQADLEMERAAVAAYNEAIELCLKERDAGTRLLLEDLLRGEEDHVQKYELMLAQIERMGEQSYLMCVCGGGVPAPGTGG